MIRAFFGLEKDPFSLESIELLPHQQEVLDILKVHSYQGGLCLLLGQPGTGKTIIKQAISQEADRKTVVVTISRTLHTYINTLKILCQAFNIEFDGAHFKCEKRLIEAALNLHREGKSLITIIDDAHLMEMDTLRKLRLMFEDFPKNHNIILVGQPELLSKMSLKINDDIKSRVTYSTIMRRLNQDQIQDFINSQLDKVMLPHNTFSEEALNLITRSSEGLLRKCRNLCLSCMLEAVRSSKKSIDLKIVNTVLLQPHWQQELDLQY